MANFKDTRINQTYQRLVQVDGAILQDGKGNTISGSMGDLTISGSLNIIGHTNVSASLSRLDSFSSSIDDIYATDVDVTAVSSRVTSLENFSSSLDATYATDEQLDIVSQSLSLETAQLLDFSASLDATFATDLQLSTAVSALNASTSSLAHKNAISGAFSITSASLASQIASLDSEYASDIQLTNLSSSAADTYLSKAGKIILSSSVQLFEVCDPRYGFTPYDARYANINSITGSFAIESSRIDSLETVVSSSALLNLTPSVTLPTNVNTGSLAVTGSTLAFYDGNNWKVVITGSTLPL